MTRLLWISVFVALAGCHAAPKGSDVPASSRAQAGAEHEGSAARTADDPCGAGPFLHLVGTPGDRVDESMFPAGTRLLRPGMVMTMDYRAERLNVVIGESGKVERVNCG